MSLAKNWCFTLNNYTQEEEENIKAFIDFVYEFVWTRITLDIK